jgi:hypothetical protein
MAIYGAQLVWAVRGAVVAMEAGIDPVHFGIIMMFNLGIGLMTPPVGSVLFVGSALGRVPVLARLRTIWPVHLTLLAARRRITFVPALSLWLPGELAGWSGVRSGCIRSTALRLCFIAFSVSSGNPTRLQNALRHAAISGRPWP